MKISIVVCVHNNLHLTRACLDSLQRHVLREGVEVLVIDDASTDDTPQAIPGSYPWVRFHRHEPNLGYGGVCTWGAGHAHGDYLVMLNNDTVVEGDFVGPLLARIDSSPKIGMVSSRLLYPDRTLQHAGLVFNRDKAPYHLYRSFPETFPAAQQARRFQAVNGASALMPRTLFRELNGFSSQYRNGYEDVDQCLRLSRLGYECWYETASCVIHFESQSPTRHRHEDRNKAQFLQAWADHIITDEGHYYQEDGFPPALWYRLSVMRNPRHHLPLRWEVSGRASTMVRDVVHRFADELHTRLGLQVAVEEADLARGAIGYIRSECGVLNTPVFMDVEGAGPRPSPCVETWTVSASGVRSTVQMADLGGLAVTDQLMALSFHCHSNSADGFLSRGRAMVRKRDERLPQFVRAFVETCPREPESHLLAGDYAWAEQDFAGALRAYQAAAEWVEPEYVALRMAQMLPSNAQQEARQKIRRVLKSKPLHVEARWLLLRSLFFGPKS